MEASLFIIFKKKFFTYGALGLFSVTAFLIPIQFSFTQTETRSPNISIDVSIAYAAEWVYCGTSPTSGTWKQGAKDSCTGGTTAQLTSSCDTNPQSDSSCKQNSPGGTPPPTKGGTSCNSFATCVADLVYIVTVGPTSIFAYIGSLFLSVGIKLSLTSTAYALDFLTKGWTVARDVANMAFLFILIFLAFSIILRADTSGTTQTLAMIVVMALLVNFSFFLTRVVIDAGNIAAVQVYNIIPSDKNIAQSANCGGSTTGTVTVANPEKNQNNFICDTTTKDLTESIMAGLNLQNLYSNKNFETWSKRNNTLTQVLTLTTLYIATAILLAILGFMFIAAGAKFLTRIVALWFLIIASPLAFAAFALPKEIRGRQWFNRWWSLLLTNTFYPAVFLFMFLLVVIFMKQGCEQAATGTATTGTECLGILGNIFNTDANAPNTDFGVSLGINLTAVAIVMGLVIIMIYMAMKVADKVSVSGANLTAKLPGWVAGRYGGAISGGGGWLGRQTLGRAGQRWSQNESLQRAAAQSGAKGVAARMLLNRTNRAAEASYDARASRLGGTVLQKTGINAGAARGVGGRRAGIESLAKQKEQFSEKLKESESAKASRAKDETSQALLEKERIALGYAKQAQDDVRKINERYTNETDPEKRKKINEELRAMQSSLAAYRTEAEEAHKERDAHINNTKAERERLGQYADTLDKGWAGVLGDKLREKMPDWVPQAPREGTTIGASRIRRNIPVAPIPPTENVQGNEEAGRNSGPNPTWPQQQTPGGPGGGGPQQGPNPTWPQQPQPAQQTPPATARPPSVDDIINASAAAAGAAARAAAQTPPASDLQPLPANQPRREPEFAAIQPPGAPTSDRPAAPPRLALDDSAPIHQRTTDNRAIPTSPPPPASPATPTPRIPELENLRDLIEFNAGAMRGIERWEKMTPKLQNVLETLSKQHTQLLKHAEKTPVDTSTELHMDLTAERSKLQDMLSDVYEHGVNVERVPLHEVTAAAAARATTTPPSVRTPPPGTPVTGAGASAGAMFTSGSSGTFINPSATPDPQASTQHAQDLRTNNRVRRALENNESNARDTADNSDTSTTQQSKNPPENNG